jgi:hypothetical protein
MMCGRIRASLDDGIVVFASYFAHAGRIVALTGGSLTLLIRFRMLCEMDQTKMYNH